MDNHLLMTASYLTKLKAEMEHTLGCEIKIVEDKDSRYPCKLEYARNYARSHHGVRHHTGWCQALPRAITLKAEQGKLLYADNKRSKNW